MLEYNFTK